MSFLDCRFKHTIVETQRVSLSRSFHRTKLCAFPPFFQFKMTFHVMLFYYACAKLVGVAIFTMATDKLRKGDPCLPWHQMCALIQGRPRPSQPKSKVRKKGGWKEELKDSVCLCCRFAAPLRCAGSASATAPLQKAHHHPSLLHRRCLCDRASAGREGGA